MILNGVLSFKQRRISQRVSIEDETEKSDDHSIQLSIPMIHVIYEISLNRIGFIKQAFNLNFIGKDQIKKQVDLSIKNDPQGKLGNVIDIMIFEEIVNDCKPDLTILQTEVDWEIWVSKVRRCQPILESNFKIVLIDQEKSKSIR